MTSAGEISEDGTSTHDEAHLYVDSVSGVSGNVWHRQPVVGVSRHSHVTHRIDTVNVTDWSRVTRFSPL